MGGNSAGSGSNPKSGGAESGAGADSAAGPAGIDSRPGAGSGADSGAGAQSLGGLESVGVDGTEQLIREAEAAAAGAPVDPLAPGAELLTVNDSWAVLMPPTVEVICGVVLPAWEIRKDDEQEPLAAAMAECMEQIFPGGIDGKYGCWVRLITVCGAITVSRVATNGGKLPPLFLPKGATTRPTPAPTPQPAPIDPMRVTSLTE
jgi:hypothetical protein